MHWLTGYDGWSFYVHQAVIVPPAGNPVWFGRGQDAAGAQRTSWLPDADIVGYPDHYVQSTERHPMDFLAGVLAERGLDRLAHRRRDGQLLVLRRRLREPAARPARTPASPDATGLVNWQRAVKSPTEIGYMRRPPASSRRCTPASPRRPAPASASATSSPRSTTPAPAARPSSAATTPPSCRCCPPGADASAPHLTWDDKPMQAGEGTFFEIAGCYHRYHCPLSRTVFLGKPTQAFLDAESRDAGRHGGRPRRREARQHLRGHRQRLLRRPREARHRQGQPHRLLDRPLLPARLGRAHHEPAPRRPHRAPARHDLPLHDRPLARGPWASRSPSRS